jgi:endonuclease YncB( thermonuclease family)
MAEHRASTLPVFAGVVLLLTAAAQEQEVPAPQRLAAEALAGPVAANVERVVDGDTIEVRAAIWLGQSLIIRVRIDGVDAPELEARCAEERKLALAARDFLLRRLQGVPVKLTHVVYDKYAGACGRMWPMPPAISDMRCWKQGWPAPITASAAKPGAA